MRVDHVMIVTLQPDRVRAWLRSTGLGLDKGGHFDDGLRNWSVPLISGQYPEVLTVDGEGGGADWVRNTVAAGRAFAGWAVEVPSVEDVAARLGRPVSPGAALDGQTGLWDVVEMPADQSFLPFFITYAWTNARQSDEHVSRREGWYRSAQHDIRPDGIERLELVGDEAAFRVWVGGDLDVRVRPGEPARLASIVLRTDQGELEVREEDIVALG